MRGAARGASAGGERAGDRTESGPRRRGQAAGAAHEPHERAAGHSRANHRAPHAAEARARTAFRPRALLLRAAAVPALPGRRLLRRTPGRQHAADPRPLALPQGVRRDLSQRMLAGSRAGVLWRWCAYAVRAPCGPGAARGAHPGARHARGLPRRDDARGAPGHARRAPDHRILVPLTETKARPFGRALLTERVSLALTAAPGRSPAWRCRS